MKKLGKKLPLLFIFIICTNCSINHNSKSSSELDTNDQIFVEAMGETTPVENKTDLETGHTEIAVAPAVKQSEVTTYEVKTGDTWMIIAQKLLGDPLKWGEIQKWNQQYKKSTDLVPGTILTYTPPANPIIQPEGLPYLIKRKDTLPKISYKVYGTKNSWDVIYYNNRQVVKTPDVIYSGFIIYYPEKDQVPVMKAQMAAAQFDVSSVRRPASVKKRHMK